MKIVRESISFERGKKPKESMGIGLDSAIRNYFKDKNDNIPLDYAIIGRILEEDDLEPETKKEWVEYLLHKDPQKYVFEDPELYWFDELDIDYLGVLPDGYKRTLSLDIEKRDGKFFVSFPEMSYLAELFDTHRRDISYESIKKVLEGDAWDIFESYVDENIAKEYLKENWDEVDTGYLVDRYQYDGGEEETSDEIVDDIFEDERFEEYKNAIVNALSDAQTNAAETQAYNDMKKKVLDHYEIGELMWNDQRQEYTAQITKDGVNKLFHASLLGDDKLEYYEPYGGYDAPVNPEWFSESLDSQLEHV